MKNSILPVSLILFLFGFFLNHSALATDGISYGLDKLTNYSSSVTAPPVMCNAPSWQTTTNITETSARFNWSEVSGAYDYSVQTRLPGGTWYYVPGSPFNNTFVTVNGFSPNTTYEWRVRANCSGEYSYWTSPVSFTTLGNSYDCEAPSWLETSNITQTTATWDWSSVSGAISYSVQWRYAGGSWNTLPGGPWTQTWLNVGGLSPGTAYEWRVRSNCAYGETSPWSYPDSFTTLGASCSTPSGTYTTNITEHSATFHWSHVSGADSYSVQTRLPNGTWSTVPGSPFYNNWATVDWFDPNTTYEWRVRANCGYNTYSYWSYPLTFTTTGSLSCEIPSGLYTTNITETSATFNWAPVSGAQSYSVQTRLPNGTWSFVPGSPFAGTSTTVNWFNPGTTYEWRVRSNCGYFNSSYWSNHVVFTTLGDDVCEAPSVLNTLNITQTTATWDWDPVPGAVSYSVQWRYAGGTWYNLPGGPWSSTALTVGGLQPGTDYEWRVRSNCSYWTYSEWSVPEAFTTLGNTCTMPTGTVTSNITDNSATFSWNPVAGAVSYSVQIRLPNGSWSFIPGSPFSGTSATVNNLSPGTNYEWRVRANCGYGYYSYWTPGMPFTTTGSFACYAPDWLGTTNVTQTTATLDWSSVTGALSYTVQLREAGGNWYDYPGGPWYNSWLNIGGLEPGTTYEWRVKSNCANGEMSEWSYIVTFTTLGNVCHTPYQTWTTNITDHSATFNWSPVSGAESYSVQIRDQWGSWNYIPGSPFYGTSATVHNLSPGTTYEWRVRANCDYGNYSYWTPGLHFTTLGSYSCHAPEDLYTTNITQTSATWDWSAVSGAESYSVQWRYAGGTWYNLPGGPWYNTWLNVGGLQPGTQYEWRVRANCGYSNYSDWSYPEFFVTLGYSCYAPTNLHESNITNDGATLHWDDVSGADSYSVQIREPWGSWYYIPGSPFNYNWAAVNNLDPNTTYEWRVRSNCGYSNYSSWSHTGTFTTSGYNNYDNDNCSEATWLDVNNSCYYVSGSSIGSTASYPAPQGNCPHSGYKDVWFKFDMPDNYNPVATIRTTAGSLNDAVMELYVGNTCGYMAFLGCEDNNNNGNGSHMPVMTVMGGQGLTIFVRIWGHYGNTGTFNICVFDYNSNNFTEGDEGHQVVTIPETFSKVDHVADGEMVIDGQDAGEMTLAPNPVNDVLNVKYGQTTESIVSTLVLTDMSGKIMVRKDYESKDVVEFHEQIDVTDLAPGIYVVQLRTTNGIVSERVSVVD